MESSYAFFLFFCLFLHRLLSFLLLSRKPASFFHYTRSSAVDRSSQHEYSTETNTIETRARVHTGVESGLPIDAEQPLAGEPFCVPRLAKSPLYEPDDSPTRRVTRNFHERFIHPFLPYLPFPFSRRTLSLTSPCLSRFLRFLRHRAWHFSDVYRLPYESSFVSIVIGGGIMLAITFFAYLWEFLSYLTAVTSFDKTL